MIDLRPLPKPPRRPRNPPVRDDTPRTLIDELLAEQKRLLTPVAEFAEVRDRVPDLADHYRSLIPLSAPGPGEQYAFEVSLDRCTGCKGCVSACHSLNGLDDDEAWRDVGALQAPGWQQTVTSACHHCGDPGCLNGCPVGAYEKDSTTGIVRHLDDQCIGCSYCILKCPYDVPKYSKKRGIVRKCDMCHQRLAEGEAPACVQACPTEAIRIVKVPVPEKVEGTLFHNRVDSDNSAVPFSSITRPSTRYVGRDVPAAAVAADRDALVVQHAHWPLVLMLMLTQAGVGLLLAGNFGAVLTGSALFYLGMGASVLHLGQPLKAWRFFIGLRTSWLSREILAFSLFAPIPSVLATHALLPHLPGNLLPEFVTPLLDLAATAAKLTLFPLGLVAVFTSVMIYHDTHRANWRFPLTAARFFGTVASFAALGSLLADPGPLASLAFAGLVILKMIPEARLLRSTENEDMPWSADLHCARLQTGPLRRILNGRFLLAFTAAAVALVSPRLALPLLLVAELFERQLFFQSVHAPKMPGSFGK